MKNRENTQMNKNINIFYEKNELPYHFIWYYIDEKTHKKKPIGEYNKATEKTIYQKIIKQKNEGIIMTEAQEKIINKINENEKKSLTTCYTAFLKHTSNIYCIDIDEENINTPLDLPEEFKKIRMSGYIKGNTKGIHIYVKILNMIEYENQQDIINILKGDLIRKNNIWEKTDKTYNYNEGYEGIMEFEWDEIRYLFNEKKMNIKGNENDEETTTNIQQNIIQNQDETTINLCGNELNDGMTVISEMTECYDEETNDLLTGIDKEKIITYIFDELYIHNTFTTYNNWLKLCFCIYNEYDGNNEGYKLLIRLCSRLSNYDEDECFKQYNKNCKKLDKKSQIRIGSLRHLFYEYYPEKKNNNEKTHIEIDYSEKGMGDLFLSQKRGYIIYQEDNLYIYYNNEWVYDRRGDLCKYVISETLIKILSEKSKILNSLYELEVNEEIKGSIYKQKKTNDTYLKNLKIIKFIGDILKNIQTTLSSKQSKIIFDIGEEHKYYIHFKNGVYDLKKKIFRKRTINDYITKYLDYDYIERDKIEQSIHDFVENLYIKIQPDKTERDFMLGYLAYCLTGDMGKQIFKINIGYTASNGKSTEMAVHDKVFPIYTKKLNKGTFNKGNTKFHKFVKIYFW